MTAVLCLDENDALRVVLEPDASGVDSLRAHVDGCDACRELVAAVARFVITGDERAETPWPSAELPAGTVLGVHRILEPIGRGAMGRVYLAEDQRLGRRVALKLLNLGVDEAVAQRRLRTEARRMARVMDPHVVEVFDVGASPRGAYVAMQYVEGPSLSTWLAHAPRSSEEVIECLEQAGRGLMAAHAAGVVHRDFKPANILVGRDGLVRVADFGLAVLREAEVPGPESIRVPSKHDDDRSRSTTNVAGTPAYMAPEQFEGKPCGPAADQFAFCVTLFEALCGHRPFTERTLKERADAIASGRIRSPRRAISRATMAVLRRGLHSDPSRRFSGMDALLHALRRPPARGWIVLAGLALAALGSGGLWLHHGPRSCSPEPLAYWQGGARGALRNAWDIGGISSHASDRLLRRLDEYAEAWSDSRRRACASEAGATRWQQRQRRRCLDAQRSEFGDFLAAAGSATERTAEGFVSTASALPPPADCLRHTAAPSRDPSLAADVIRLRGSYLRWQARGDGSDPATLRAETRTMIERAEHGGAVLQQATLWHLLGVLDGPLDRTTSRESFERAYFLAKDGKDPALAFDAAVATARVFGFFEQRTDEARRWIRHARVLVIDLDDPRRAQLLRLEGDLQVATSEHAKALESFRRAEALLDPQARPESLADLYGSMGQVFAMLGDEKSCRETYARALRSIEQTYGPEHHELVRPLLGIAGCELEPEFHASGLAHLERGLALSLAHGSGLGEATARANLGLFHTMLEHPTAALHELSRADALLREQYPEEHPILARSAHDLAAAHLAVGHNAEASTIARSARRWFEDQANDPESFAFACELIEAQAQRGLGDPAMAKRFEDLLERAPDEPQRARARIALGEVLLAEGLLRQAITTLAPLYVDGAPMPEISILRVAEGRSFYAQALLARGDHTEGRRQLELAWTTAAPHADDDPRGVTTGIQTQR